MKKQSGFSLVELMIVVAIMAILAAIAIPSFLKFQTKAKESEARNNLAAIRTCEESYRAEEDRYLDCAPSPGAIPVAESLDWVDGGGFETIGFAPSGKVRFQYAVDADAAQDDTAYVATAEGDLTGDEIIHFEITDTNPKAQRSIVAGP